MSEFGIWVFLTIIHRTCFINFQLKELLKFSTLDINSPVWQRYYFIGKYEALSGTDNIFSNLYRVLDTYWQMTVIE